jgi:hypothetical protein
MPETRCRRPRPPRNRPRMYREPRGYVDVFLAQGRLNGTVAPEHDGVMTSGVSAVSARRTRCFLGCRVRVLIDWGHLAQSGRSDAGHWVQQEQPSSLVGFFANTGACCEAQVGVGRVCPLVRSFTLPGNRLESAKAALHAMHDVRYF